MTPHLHKGPLSKCSSALFCLLATCLGAGLPAPSALAADAQPAPAFGSDLSMGIGLGTLLGTWPDPGLHSWLGGRYDAFVVPADRRGARLGASIFASGTLGLLPQATEQESDVNNIVTFSCLHYGVLSALRLDPRLPWSGLVSFGFSRLDLSTYWGAPYAVPMITFEAGLRRRMLRRDPRPFLDMVARLSWGSIIAPNPYDGLDELWLLQVATWLGFHAR